MLNEALSKNIVSLEEKGVQIIQKDVKIEAVGNMLVMDGYMTVQGNDGKSQPVQEPVSYTHLSSAGCEGNFGGRCGSTGRRRQTAGRA